MLCFLGLHAWRMQKQPFSGRCVWCNKEKGGVFFPLKSNVPSPAFPSPEERRDTTPRDELGEQLAAVEHKRRSQWIHCLLTKGVQNPDGTLTIDAERVARWQRQMHMSYRELSEAEKERYRRVKNTDVQGTGEGRE